MNFTELANLDSMFIIVLLFIRQRSLPQE